MKRALILTSFLTMMTGQTAQASACEALAIFFQNVVKASKAELKPETFKKQVTDIQRSKGTCEEALARLRDTKTYTHRIGAPLTPLQEYLVNDAKFTVDVVGKGDKIEVIEFDIDAVGALRRRPTR